MTHYYLTAYPWDLVDEGVEAALDRLHGETGVNGLSLMVGLPPVVQLRARAVEPRIFRTRGGLFFKPDESRYQATRLKPIASTWLGSRNPLGQIAQGCEGRTLALRVIVSAARIGRLARRYPEMACKNAFADVSRDSLCLANPDVQSFLVALASDVTSSYPVSGLVLTDFVIGWSEAFGDGLLAPIVLGDVERLALSTCFCESCRQGALKAGVDVDAACEMARAMLHQAMEAGRAVEGPLEKVLVDHPALTDYRRWQVDELSALLARVKEACGAGLILAHHPGPQDCLLAKIDRSIPTAIRTTVDDLDDLTSAELGQPHGSELHISAPLFVQAEAPRIVQTFTRAAELGFAAIDVDGFGLLPAGSLDSLRQAIRFARRSTVG